MKKVAPRNTEMKNNTIKMHLVHHIASNILVFGVPQNMNSAFAASAHIQTSKVTAQNTQRRPNTLTLQAAEQYVENLAIARGHMEMELATDIPINNNRTPPKEQIKCLRQFLFWKEDNLSTQCCFPQWKKFTADLTSIQVDKLSEVVMNERIKDLIVKHCLPSSMSPSNITKLTPKQGV
jgi:hypothetical protein